MFDSFIGQISGNTDMLLSETKLDESFPIGQFFIIEGFGVPYRAERNANLSVRGYIPPKHVSPIEAFFVE